jgi:alpha-galactosidase
MSLFYPPEMIGAHFGHRQPHDIPAPGRCLPGPRGGVRTFRHRGGSRTPQSEEREQLARHVADYKKWRALIHSGDQLYADCDDPGVTVEIVVCEGRERGARFVRAHRSERRRGRPAHTPPGAAAEGALCGEPRGALAIACRPSPCRQRILALEAGARWRGAGEVGLRVPIVHPETAWVIHLQRVER